MKTNTFHLAIVSLFPIYRGKTGVEIAFGTAGALVVAKFCDTFSTDFSVIIFFATYGVFLNLN